MTLTDYKDFGEFREAARTVLRHDIPDPLLMFLWDEMHGGPTVLESIYSVDEFKYVSARHVEFRDAFGIEALLFSLLLRRHRMCKALEVVGHLFVEKDTAINEQRREAVQSCGRCVDQENVIVRFQTENQAENEADAVCAVCLELPDSDKSSAIKHPNCRCQGRQTFCRQCLEDLFRFSTRCPTCRGELRNEAQMELEKARVKLEYDHLDEELRKNTSEVQERLMTNYRIIVPQIVFLKSELKFSRKLLKKDKEKRREQQNLDKRFCDGVAGMEGWRLELQKLSAEQLNTTLTQIEILLTTRNCFTWLDPPSGLQVNETDVPKAVLMIFQYYHVTGQEALEAGNIAMHRHGLATMIIGCDFVAYLTSCTESFRCCLDWLAEMRACCLNELKYEDMQLIQQGFEPRDQDQYRHFNERQLRLMLKDFKKGLACFALEQWTGFYREMADRRYTWRPWKRDLRNYPGRDQPFVAQPSVYTDGLPLVYFPDVENF